MNNIWVIYRLDCDIGPHYFYYSTKEQAYKNWEKLKEASRKHKNFECFRNDIFRAGASYCQLYRCAINIDLNVDNI